MDGFGWLWLPLLGVFVVFQLLTRAFKPKGLARIGVGLVYTLWVWCCFSRE